VGKWRERRDFIPLHCAPNEPSGLLLDPCLAPIAVITWRVMTEAQDIGRVLKKLREDAGLSQRELAQRLGVQQPAVARWEAGGVRMPINRIEEILAHFGYGIEYDLTAIPISETLRNGVPLQMVRRRPEMLGTNSEYSLVRSSGYEFAVNPAAPWSVDMWEVTSGRKLPGAVAVYPERIEAIVPHPDGVLIRFGTIVGKITPNLKRHEDGSLVFTYSLAGRRDLELAGVARDPSWPGPSA
jgi:transcriptional regulator with XRE-family HTH domain